jgi:dTDP-4-dehydrorhamnose 3,5-epimerase
MLVEPTALADVLILTPRRFSDARGWFCETWNRETLLAHGIDTAFVQDNHAFTERRGTVRGLHFQRPPRAQAKLVRCTRGAIRDVAVDIRKGSPSFGRWVAVELSAENGRQLLVPVGFLHGYATLTDTTEVLYKCSDTYAPDCDGAVRFDDPEIGIDWGIDPASAILSDKDRAAPLLRNFATPFTYDPAA